MTLYGSKFLNLTEKIVLGGETRRTMRSIVSLAKNIKTHSFQIRPKGSMALVTRLSVSLIN